MTGQKSRRARAAVVKTSHPAGKRGVDTHSRPAASPFSAGILGNQALTALLRTQGVQAKLRMGPVDDHFEQEADRVADQVVSMPAVGEAQTTRPIAQAKSESVWRESATPVRAKPVISRVPGSRVQRQDFDDEKEEEVVQAKHSSSLAPLIQRQSDPGEEEEEDLVQMKADGVPRPVSQGAESSISAVRSSGGSPLSPETRSYFEPRFGRDFGNVRIHTGPQAADAARSIQAKAFTVGGDIAFGSGQFDPDSDTGRRLIGHELTHVVQQGGGAELVQRDPNERRVIGVITTGAELDPEAIDIMFKIQEGTATEQDKQRLRGLLATASLRELREYISETKATGLSAEEKADLQRMKEAIRAALETAKKIPRAKERAARIKGLQLLDGLLDDQAAAAQLTLQGNVAKIQHLGNPEVRLTPKQLESLNRQNSIIAQGAQVFLFDLFLRSNIRELGLEKDLADKNEKPPGRPVTLPAETPPEERAAGGPPGGLPVTPEKPVTEEERGEVDILNTRIDEAGIERVPGEPAGEREVADALAELSEEDKELFIEMLKREQKEKGKSKRKQPAPVSLGEALRRFNALSKAEKEILRINKELDTETATEQAEISKKVALRLKKESQKAAQATSDVERMNEALDSIRDFIRDDELRKQAEPIDPNKIPLFTEIVMFESLLSGASQKSPEIRTASTQLLKEMRKALDRIQKEILWLAAQLATEQVIGLLLAAPTAGGSVAIQGTRAALVLYRLNKLRKLIDRLHQVYAVADRVRSIIQAVQKAAKAAEDFEKFQQKFEKMQDDLTAIQKRLDDLDAPDNLEEEMEKLEEKINQQLEEQLGQGLGEVLESMYIPEDASVEELQEIFFNIPRGLEVMDGMLDFYDSGNRRDPEFNELLALKAFEAGVLLYPLVGFLAAQAGEQLSSVFPEKTIDQRLQRLVTRVGSRRGRARRDKNMGLLARLRGTDLNYNTADLQSKLDMGTTWLRKKIMTDEPKESWARTWFRFVMRSRVKELQKHARKSNWTVRATPKKKPKGGGTGEKRVPVPRFKLRWPLFSIGQKTLKVDLKLNPSKTIEVDQLDYTDFQKKAIPYKRSSKKRRKALQEWLEDRDYEITTENNGALHLRLRGKKATPGFLRFIGNDIKSGIDKKPFNKFKDRQVKDASDLPEGYFILSRGGGGFVSLKPEAKKLGMEKLGTDEEGKLVKGEGFRRVEQKRAAVVNITEESYDWQKALDTTFDEHGEPKSGYKNDGTRPTWENRQATKHPDLNKRPTRVKADLGYTVNARTGSDTLHRIKVPEMKKGDDKGHLVARRFGGADELKNVIPMKSSVNQRGGKWYKWETNAAKVYVGKVSASHPDHFVRADITLRYGNTWTRRPSGFTVASSMLGPGGSKPNIKSTVGISPTETMTN